MIEYPSIQNLYARDPETHASGPAQGFKNPAVSQISHWLVTEKVDGMNMRVIWTPEVTGPTVTISGRTDRANLPGQLVTAIQEWATPEAFTRAFAVPVFETQADQAQVPVDISLPESVCLYGEGFGPGIQGGAGAAYGGEKRFILFDVLVDGKWWLQWSDVCDVAAKMGIPHVPDFGYGPLIFVENLVFGRESALLPDGEHVEGVVARTDPYLFDGRGNRVMFKYKVRDL